MKSVKKLSSSRISAHLPDEMIDDAFSVLYAIRSNKAIFNIAPTFDTQSINPFFGMSIPDLASIAEESSERKNFIEPWKRKDIDVSTKMTLIRNSFDSEGFTPILVIKADNPSEHLALISKFSIVNDFRAQIKLFGDYFSLNLIRNKTGEDIFGFYSQVDPLSKDLLKISMSRTNSPSFIISIPTDTSFFEEISKTAEISEDRKPLAHSLNISISSTGQKTKFSLHSLIQSSIVSKNEIKEFVA